MAGSPNIEEYSAYLETLPRKQCATSAILFDKEGRILILKDLYHDKWVLPGGVIEEFESPVTCYRREIKEETGLNVENLKLVALRWMIMRDGKHDSIQFMFCGGEIADDQVNAIALRPGEISEHKFVPVNEALNLVTDYLKFILPLSMEALKNNTVAYIETPDYINQS